MQVQTTDGFLLNLDDVVVENCLHLQDKNITPPKESLKLKGVKLDVMKTIIEWCRMSTNREIFDIPEGESREWRWSLAKWNSDFLLENRGQLIELTLAAIELGSNRLKESCCLAIAMDIRENGSASSFLGSVIDA
ncbi:unnamed protein product [Rodentolepis nana]|uniref:Skp1_POZ domain-containing protein n=1 Tax=Rodentolepis nana TaxID=102285 RepID=A0A0R3T3S9_RODNA|nr:unnamed protein product [Rodentolepis nana]